MKPFNLADVNQFEIETNSGLITLLLPREGGQPARLEIVEAALPRLLMTLIAASVQLRENVGPLPPPSENPPEGRVHMPLPFRAERRRLAGAARQDRQGLKAPHAFARFHTWSNASQNAFCTADIGR